MRQWLGSAVALALFLMAMICLPTGAEEAPSAEATPAAAGGPEAAPADSGMGGYKRMEIEYVGLMDGTLDGRINKMAGGVKIKLVAGKPDQKDLPISAKTMTFTYAEGASKPTRIVLEGNVSIQHPQASVTADKADWDMEKGELVFTGNPIMRSDRVKEMRGSKMILNFEKNAFQVSDVRIPEFDTSQGAPAPGAPNAGAPPAISDGDVSDWTGFVDALKAAAVGAAASPGKQLAARGGEQMQAALRSMPTEEILKNKEMVLKAINGILRKPGFYNRAAWEGVALSDELNALLTKGTLSAEEQVRQNYLLLQAAFPNFVAVK